MLLPSAVSHVFMVEDRRRGTDREKMAWKTARLGPWRSIPSEKKAKVIRVTWLLESTNADVED